MGVVDHRCLIYQRPLFSPFSVLHVESRNKRAPTASGPALGFPCLRRWSERPWSKPWERRYSLPRLAKEYTISCWYHLGPVFSICVWSPIWPSRWIDKERSSTPAFVVSWFWLFEEWSGECWRLFPIVLVKRSGFKTLVKTLARLTQYIGQHVQRVG